MIDLTSVKHSVKKWIDRAPLEIVVAILDERDGYCEYSDETIDELKNATNTYLCWLWVEAAKQKSAGQIYDL